MATQAFPRKRRRLLVQFVDANGAKQTGFTHDVSFTGFLVLADSLPEVGAPLTLTLHLPSGKAVAVTGNVVRQGQPPAVAMRLARAGFGVALTELCQDYANFVATLG